MGATFTITQSPVCKNLYLYPSGNAKVALTPVGEAINYSCVDETYDLPDDDTSYVFNNSISIVTDIYSLPNHTTETGTINYVKVISRAKSHTYPQNATGIYKQLISISATTYSSSDINLTTDYTSYNTIWASSPTDDVTSWTWTDIDNLKIGIACSSPTITGYNTNLILRPEADGSITHLSSTSVDHYTTIDEETSDNTDYIENIYSGMTLDTDYDTFYFPDHTTETGTINSLSIYHHTYVPYLSSEHCLTPMLLIGITSKVSFFGTARCGYIYPTLYSSTWTSNPSTSIAWTWADVDAVEAGVRCTTKKGHTTRCNQLYIVVNHLENVNPDIRTTQCYAIVNYVPSSSTCYLNQPIDYSYGLNYEIQKQNWWNSTRTTRTIYRTSKTLNMNGVEYSSTATATLKCIENMKDNGIEIVFSGMTDTNLNTSWIIKNFSYNMSPDNNNLWNWDMTLEKT